jgi:hypothetical protein
LSSGKVVSIPTQRSRNHLSYLCAASLFEKKTRRNQTQAMVLPRHKPEFLAPNGHRVVNVWVQLRQELKAHHRPPNTTRDFGPTHVPQTLTGSLTLDGSFSTLARYDE